MLLLRQMIPSYVKPYAHGIIWKYRLLTSSNRDSPDFIIIGAQKSGTSSVFSYLAQHPHILPASKKEVHFFDGGLNPREDNFDKGPPWYRAHFPLGKSINHRTFEASPLYIFNPLAPQRIAHLMPEVKLIALLRNPTERAISHYFHETKKGRESLPIHKALKKEKKRLEPAIEEKDYKSDVFIHYSYKTRGLYKKQLERYLKYFPMEQILVISSEELFAETNMCLRRIYEFVGVDPDYKAGDLRPRNVANNRRKMALLNFEWVSGMPGATKKSLVGHGR